MCARKHARLVARAAVQGVLEAARGAVEVGRRSGRLAESVGRMSSGRAAVVTEVEGEGPATIHQARLLGEGVAVGEEEVVVSRLRLADKRSCRTRGVAALEALFGGPALGGAVQAQKVSGRIVGG